MWLALGITLVAGIVALRPCTPEYLIRWTGLLLQLAGVITVAWGLHSTRKLFGHPSLVTTTSSWLKRFPFRKRKPIHASAFAAAGRATTSGRGYATHPPPANPTTDQRLDALERSIVLLHDRISGNEDVTQNEFSKAAEALKEERHTRRAEDQAISKRLEETGTGGIHISAMGALWLFLGVILSSGSVEIAQWLR